MYRVFFLMLMFVLVPACSAHQEQPSTKSYKPGEKELEQLDTAIEKLTNLRNLELAKAARYQDQGDRLQFRQNQLMDARRYWQMADNSREIAARYQEEIDKLEVKRKAVIEQYNLKDPRLEKHSTAFAIKVPA